MDVVTDGQTTLKCTERSGLKRSGGQGDVLAGNLLVNAWEVDQLLWLHLLSTCLLIIMYDVCRHNSYSDELVPRGCGKAS